MFAILPSVLVLLQSANMECIAGMNQAGLPECIVRAVNSCHPYLHSVLYERWLLEVLKC